MGFLHSFIYFFVFHLKHFFPFNKHWNRWLFITIWMRSIDQYFAKFFSILLLFFFCGFVAFVLLKPHMFKHHHHAMNLLHVIKAIESLNIIVIAILKLVLVAYAFVLLTKVQQKKNSDWIIEFQSFALSTYLQTNKKED